MENSRNLRRLETGCRVHLCVRFFSFILLTDCFVFVQNCVSIDCYKSYLMYFPCGQMNTGDLRMDPAFLSKQKSLPLPRRICSRRCLPVSNFAQKLPNEFA